MSEASLTKPPLRGPVPFVAVLAAIIASFVLMPVWHGYPPSRAVETYAVSPEDFQAKVDAMVAAHATGEEAFFTGDQDKAEGGLPADGIPVVRPPEGDVYVLARRWHFWPYLELEEGRTYRLHVSSGDILHGFHLTDALDFLLQPGAAQVFTLTASRDMPLAMQCSEYCGLEHYRMKATIRVVPAR